MRSGTAAGTAGTGHGRAGAALPWHPPEEAAPEPREPKEERARPYGRLPPFPFPGEGQAAGADRPGVCGSQAAASGARDPRVTHPPGHREPFAAGAELPFPAVPRRDSPTRRRRLAGGGRAAARRAAGRGAAAWLGWAGLCRDTRSNERQVLPERALAVPRRRHRPYRAGGAHGGGAAPAPPGMPRPRTRRHRGCESPLTDTGAANRPSPRPGHAVRLAAEPPCRDTAGHGPRHPLCTAGTPTLPAATVTALRGAGGEEKGKGEKGKESGGEKRGGGRKAREGGKRK